MAVVVVLGRKGSGKSTLIRERIRDRWRLIVHDPVWQHAGECQQVATVPEACHVLATKDAFRVAVGGPDERNADLLCKAAIAAGDVTLVFDECDWSFSATEVPPSFKALISYSRHYKIDIIAAARRPASIPRILTSQADEIVSFRMSEPRDLAYLRDFAGRDFAERVAVLGPHEFATWRAEGVDSAPSL